MSDVTRGLEVAIARVDQRVSALESEALKLIPLAALDVFATDPHRFSNRPCGTCKTVSAIIGREWGCMLREGR